MKPENIFLKHNRSRGAILALVVVIAVILLGLGFGMLMIAYNVRYHSIRTKNETKAMLAAESGYEEAIFWMSQQQDLAYVMQGGNPYTSSIDIADLDNSSCEYEVRFYDFLQNRPSYRITTRGLSGRWGRTIDVIVVQALGGWEMGKCRVPLNTNRGTAPVWFTGGENIYMPIHINEQDDSPDVRDIYVRVNPRFLEPVSMGEPQYAGDTNKYPDSILSYFEAGIAFDQPDSRITDLDTVKAKIDRFESFTAGPFKYTNLATDGSIPNAQEAVQLEFFVDGGVGKVRITKNCTVRGVTGSSYGPWDFRVVPYSEPENYERYPIYGYHVRNAGADAAGERRVHAVTDTYVTQKIGDANSRPGGQIYVDGNIIIGGDVSDLGIANEDQVVKGQVTVVATGNIWVADSIWVDGPHGGAFGLPSDENPSALGLVAERVIRVADPGLSETFSSEVTALNPATLEYSPIGRLDGGGAVYVRHLPNPTVVEAAVIVGGGGWGAENVLQGSAGGRKDQTSGGQDQLLLHGAITEVIRSVVGLIGRDGYLKQYYFDRRLLRGILPGDIWLKNKYIPAPAGWKDYRSDLEEP